MMETAFCPPQVENGTTEDALTLPASTATVNNAVFPMGTLHSVVSYFSTTLTKGQHNFLFYKQQEENP